jgi:tetrahydromethanopterin S-methyltransferase subunit B
MFENSLPSRPRSLNGEEKQIGGRSTTGDATGTIKVVLYGIIVGLHTFVLIASRKMINELTPTRTLGC